MDEYSQISLRSVVELMPLLTNVVPFASTILFRDANFTVFIALVELSLLDMLIPKVWLSEYDMLVGRKVVLSKYLNVIFQLSHVNTKLDVIKEKLKVSTFESTTESILCVPLESRRERSDEVLSGTSLVPEVDLDTTEADRESASLPVVVSDSTILGARLPMYFSLTICTSSERSAADMVSVELADHIGL